MSIPAIEAEAAGWAAKKVLWVVAIVAALILAVLFYWLVFIRPANNAQQATTAKDQAIVSNKQNEGAQAAIGIVNKNGNAATHTADQTRKNYVYITKQPGADTAVTDDVYNAFVQSVCMRNAAAADPQCGGLHGPNSP